MKKVAGRDLEVDVVDRDDVAVGLAGPDDLDVGLSCRRQASSPGCRGRARARRRRSRTARAGDDVAVEAAGEQHEALLAGGGQRPRPRPGALLGELEREHRAETAHLRPAGAIRSSRSRTTSPISTARGRTPGQRRRAIAFAAAQAAGLPPNVPPSPPGAGASISSARPVTDASGRPPPSDLPATSRSGSTP